MPVQREVAGPEVVQETLTHFRQRDDYIEDRAYRLLAAAAAGVLFDFGRSKHPRA